MKEFQSVFRNELEEYLKINQGNHGSFRYGKPPCRLPPSSWIEKVLIFAENTLCNLPPCPSGERIWAAFIPPPTEGKTEDFPPLLTHFLSPTAHGHAGHRADRPRTPSHGS